MATKKHIKELSHPLEVITEVCAIKEAERRLRGIVQGFKMAEVGADAAHLREVLRSAVQDQANNLGGVAERLHDLVAPGRRKAVA